MNKLPWISAKDNPPPFSINPIMVMHQPGSYWCVRWDGSRGIWVHYMTGEPALQMDAPWYWFSLTPPEYVRF